jgi:RNA polymerase sigma-70 factor (ECF subfamily)
MHSRINSVARAGRGIRFATNAGRSDRTEILAVNPEDSTTSSLLRRAMAREPEAWERLVRLYSPLVRHWCRQWGVAEHEVADVTQEVFAAVVSSLGQFRPDQPGTTFRGWMRGITRHKLLNHTRDRGEPAVGGTDAQVRLQEVPAPADDVELSEGPADVTELYQRALRLVQHQVEDRTWTAFWRATVESRTTAEVAAELGITPNAVRLAKSHVLCRLREEMGELIA